MDHQAEPPLGDLPAAVRTRLEREADVVLAYLVDPRRTAMPQGSDSVEVAVLLERAPQDRSRALELRAVVEEAAGAGRADLVLLNEAPVETAYRALTQGCLLLARDERVRAHHAWRTIEGYFEMDSLRQMLATGLRHRLERGGSGPA